jgi:hypothetical protein
MEARKNILIFLKSITGTQYLLLVLLIAFIKYLFDYSIPIVKDIKFFDLFLINISGAFLITLNWFRTRRFLEWKYYFSLMVIFGLIHSIAFTFFETLELLNSKFYLIVKLSTIGNWIITLIISILDSNKITYEEKNDN